MWTEESLLSKGHILHYTISRRLANDIGGFVGFRLKIPHKWTKNQRISDNIHYAILWIIQAMLVIGNIFDSSDILREIRLLEHFSQTPLFCKLFSRASLFGEQSIASLPKKHSFLPKEALLSFRIVVFLYFFVGASILCKFAKADINLFHAYTELWLWQENFIL